MDVEEALYRGLTTKSPRTEGQIRGMVRELDRAHGVTPKTPYAAADALGIPRRTWRRWRAGGVTKVAPARFAALRRAQRLARLGGQKRADDLMAGRYHVGVSATIRISSDTRDRKVIVTGWPGNANMMGAILPPWLRGEDQLAADRFVKRMESGLDGAPRRGTDRSMDLDVSEIRFYRHIDDARAWQRR